MSALTLRCMRSAFAFLAVGVALGVGFAFQRSVGPMLRPLHADLNLWGWVTLLIYGFAYHMLPRFTGRPLRWSRAADAQSWLAIAGVAAVVAGWLLTLWGAAIGRPVIVLGGALQLISAVMFAALIADLLRPAPVLRP